MPGGDADGMYDDIEDGFLETLLVLCLAGSLVFLIYYRNHRRERHRRNQEAAAGHLGGEGAPQGQQPEPDRGVFPPPDDPGFNDWVAGGIGH